MKYISDYAGNRGYDYDRRDFTTDDRRQPRKEATLHRWQCACGAWEYSWVDRPTYYPLCSKCNQEGSDANE